jgi:cell division protein FtsB
VKKFVGFVFIFLVIVLIFVPSYSRMRDIQGKNKDYLQQINDLSVTNQDLREELRRLKEDPEYLEKVAREKMGLVRDKEVIYRMTPMDMEIGD